MTSSGEARSGFIAGAVMIATLALVAWFVFVG
jgi:hypothetical protein